METITVTALICLTLIYFLERLLRARPSLPTPPVESPAVSAPTKQHEPFPADLAQLAMQESADWARQDTIKAMQELYEATKNWDTVRAVWTSSHDNVQ